MHRFNPAENRYYSFNNSAKDGKKNTLQHYLGSEFATPPRSAPNSFLSDSEPGAEQLAWALWKRSARCINLETLWSNIKQQ